MITKKPEFFLIFLILVLSFFLFSNTSHAVYSGDDTYTDRNNTIILAYSPIGNDLIYRLDTLKNSQQYNNIMTYLNNGNYGYYLYYNDVDGLSMINGSTYQMGKLNVAFYDLSLPNRSTSTYDNYVGIDTDIMINNGIIAIFELSDNIYYDNNPGFVQMPAILYNYKLDNVTNYLKNGNFNVSQSIEELQETIMEQDETQADTDIGVSYNDISVSSTSQDSNSTSLFSFISGFWSIIQNSLSNENVETLTISLPFVSGGVTFRSDMLYNIIQGTLIYTLLQLCYYYVFGMYIVMGTWRLLCWFQQGEFTKAKNLPIDNVMNHMLM